MGADFRTLGKKLGLVSLSGGTRARATSESTRIARWLDQWAAIVTIFVLSIVVVAVTVALTRTDTPTRTFRDPIVERSSP